jgi:NAD(P)-dependent dehydrogenase (short-subunit alcohol dehydrogenase family)
VTKAGLTNLTRQLAIEWAHHGILVNAVAPSYFPTEMTVDPRIGDVDPEQKARMQQWTPLGRLGREGEVETAILFLAAPASSYVTGSIVSVDGGWTAW